MVASCVRSNYGLVAYHAYTVLDAVNLGGTQLIKVMNPWGNERYTGPWNDNDYRWTDAFKRQVNLKVDDNGIFYMPLSVFKASFATFQVAMYQNW